MREHEDFIPEPDSVPEEDGRIIGNIMCARAELAGEADLEKDILTFAPSARSRNTNVKDTAKRLWSTPSSGRRSWAMTPL